MALRAINVGSNIQTITKHIKVHPIPISSTICMYWCMYTVCSVKIFILFIHDVEVRHLAARCRGCGWEWLFLYCSTWHVVDGAGNAVGVHLLGLEGGLVLAAAGTLVVLDFHRWLDSWSSPGIHNLTISGEQINKGIKSNQLCYKFSS